MDRRGLDIEYFELDQGAIGFVIEEYEFKSTLKRRQLGHRAFFQANLKSCQPSLEARTSVPLEEL